MFSHDTEHALDRVVDLLNTAPSGDTGDGLADVAALRAFATRHTISDLAELTADDLAQVQALRGSLAAVFDAPDDRAAAAAVNRLVSQAAVTPRLTDHDGYAWHVHYVAPGASLRDHLSVDCGMALAQVVAEGERERLRRCAAPDCENVLVDVSRNRSRRYCDARTCGNRLHVAAYRERRRTGA